jgi:hypothetical protein
MEWKMPFGGPDARFGEVHVRFVLLALEIGIYLGEIVESGRRRCNRQYTAPLLKKIDPSGPDRGPASAVGAA